MWLSNQVFIKIVILVILLVTFYYCLLTKDVRKNDNWTNLEKENYTPIFQATVKKLNLTKTLNIWCIFTKVTVNAPLQYKFQTLVKSLLDYSSRSLHIHVITDNFSKVIATKILNNAKNVSMVSMIYSFYDVKESAELVTDIVQTMTPYFSSQPGEQTKYKYQVQVKILDTL